MTPLRFNPFSPQFREDPYPLYARLRAERPVLRTMGMWVVSRHADVETVLRSKDFGAGLIPQLVAKQAQRLGASDVARIGRLGAKSLVFTDNPDHARLRGLVNRVFTAQAVARLTPAVQRVAGRLIEKAVSKKSFDVVEDLAAPLPIAVLSEWMALPPELSEQVGAWTHDIRFLLEPGLMTAEDFSRVVEVTELFAAALDELVQQRRENPGKDLISELLAASTSKGDRLSDEELVFICIMCFVAGNETTKSLIASGLLALLQHPEQGRKLQENPELVRGAVGEALRYDSPLQMTKRIALRDTQIAGQAVAEGDQVLLCVGAANRDPEVFPDPDAFDITRDTRRHLAFGHGMHGCLGGVLAQAQAEAFLTHLFSLPVHLTQEGPVQWQEHSFIVRGPQSLPVQVEV